MRNVASDTDVARLIILIDLKRFAGNHKQHLVSVCVFGKTYDTTWKYGIMKYLHVFGLRGRRPNFVYNVLKDRYFKVRLGSTFSDSHPHEMGVTHGSILSVTLFSVKNNSITYCLKPDVDCSLCVDDFQICYRSSNMSIMERQLRLYIATGVGSGVGGGGNGGHVHPTFLIGGNGMICAPPLTPPPPPHTHTLLTPHYYFPLELYVCITLTNNYLAFFIYQLIILWTISIN